MIEYLTLEDAIALIDDLQLGPLRDVGLLDSAAYRPRATVSGVDAYPEIDQKGAVLLESLVRNRALIDGNKRLGLAGDRRLLRPERIELEAPDDDAYDLVIAIAIAIAIASGGTAYENVAAQLSGWH